MCPVNEAGPPAESEDTPENESLDVARVSLGVDQRQSGAPAPSKQRPPFHSEMTPQSLHV